MDELAQACGIDPVELRVRNDPAVDPESGMPWSSRDLVGCLREGARRFGWEGRDPAPGVRREGFWLVGNGVASAVDPVYRMPGSNHDFAEYHIATCADIGDLEARQAAALTLR
ncbi:MAG: molybdopterin-dependent oxidoreductase [Solirubrobacteraceae bacterium MAG38_C4-C5]|nr:molybdopterin-dependent oxidoreductase [Candidatus Siliceabacter maunaloa]